MERNIHNYAVTVIIHGNTDDFTSQPSGTAGKKLACGVIKRCNSHIG